MKSEHLRVLLALCDSDVFWSTEKLYRHFKSSKDPINFGVVEYALRKFRDGDLIEWDGEWTVNFEAVSRLAAKRRGNKLYDELLMVCDSKLRKSDRMVSRVRALLNLIDSDVDDSNGSKSREDEFWEQLIGYRRRD